MLSRGFLGIVSKPEEKPPKPGPVSSTSFTKDDVDYAAAVFARFAKLLDGKLDEYMTFEMLREIILIEGIDLENVGAVVAALRETRFDPTRDILH